MARKFDVHILLYSEDDIQIAHCLEFDIVAQGKKKMSCCFDTNSESSCQNNKKIEALKNLLDAIKLQISFALENNDLASIFTPAPAEYWKMLIDDDTTDPSLRSGQALIDERGVVYFVNQNSGKSAFVHTVSGI